MLNKKELIIKLLEKEKELSITRIANLISANNYRTEILLNELKKEGKVSMILTRKGAKWILK